MVIGEEIKIIEDITTNTSRRFMALPIMLEFMNLIYDLRWMILLALVLVIGDFWFGISESKYIGIKIRKSRAYRRTINKFIDYILYILIGALLGKAMGSPFGIDPIVIATITMILCYGFEIDSIYGHICVLHGIKNRISIWRILLMIITFRFKGLQAIFNDMAEQIETGKSNK